MLDPAYPDPETRRLAEDEARVHWWKRWGPYLPERQWGTIREDYSASGACWEYFPHDHARSRAYRWGEDGLLGLTDRHGLLCFAPALWNGRDAILKERLFGLNHAEGNHGEDVKECYFYLDSTPTHSYMRALYKYPQGPFPYGWLVYENRCRGLEDPEFELLDTGAFDEDRYFDLTVEYAKAAPDDLLIRLTVANRGPEAAWVHVLPHVWFRSTWSWGCPRESDWGRPRIWRAGDGVLALEHAALGRFRLHSAPLPDGTLPQLLFTENETNWGRLTGGENATPWVKDAFHHYLINGWPAGINWDGYGTKAAAYYPLHIGAGEEAMLRLRLFPEDAAPGEPLGGSFEETFAQRREEADRFYAQRLPASLSDDERRVARQALAGLQWSKQFYYFSVRDWLKGDPAQPPPPPGRTRNWDWQHVHNDDVLSVPDKWEYPWYAAWDLAFHMVPYARIDPHFAKQQLILLLREWYMHPSGQLPAYEFAFADVNPPVHAWAALRVYQAEAELTGKGDRAFLARVFHKLLINFTWWVNRKDIEGRHIFSGGFLGLDNIGVFDRGRPLPRGGQLAQADGTAWMGFYSSVMLAIALELASEDPVYEDVASKFFEHFIAITDAINTLGGTGLWDEVDGFYYDRILYDHVQTPVRVRSLVGLVPLFAAQVLDLEQVERLPGFHSRLRWFLENREDLARHVETGHPRLLLTLPSRDRLERLLRYLLDESEFLSPYGIRSLSRAYADQPYVLELDGVENEVRYAPGESQTRDFGANSNWRGPIWFPLNYLLLEALGEYGRFYGEDLRVETPTGSGNWLTLAEVSDDLAARLTRLFLRREDGSAPWHGSEPRYRDNPHWRDLVLFHEYFHGDTGRGIGANHQTGWTALVVNCLERLARRRQ